MWNSILGHYNIENDQGLLQNGIIIPKQPGAGTCVVPMCRSCMAGKTKQVRHKIIHHTTNSEYTAVLKKKNLKSGDQVNTDYYECRLKGRFQYTKGKEDSKEMLLEVQSSLIMLQDLSRYITKSL